MHGPQAQGEQVHARLGVTTSVLEWSGTALGILGALLLALKQPAISPLGWWCFLASNLCWIGYSARQGIKGLKLQHLAFLATSVLGIIIP